MAMSPPSLALVSATTLSACDAGKSGEPEVVASFYPLQYVAQRIVGDHAKVTNLTAPGVEPHDVELSPRQVARVSGASVVFYEKGLQPAVDEAVKNNGPKHVVDAADAVDLRHGDSSENGDVDPHFWQDPILLAKAADAFTVEMSKADPKHASDFAAGNGRLQRDLTTLDGELRAGLENAPPARSWSATTPSSTSANATTSTYTRSPGSHRRRALRPAPRRSSPT